VTEDPRGPWELLWHLFLDNVNDDPYTLFVYGKCLVWLQMVGRTYMQSRVMNTVSQ
jgi:hypothetical protein